MKTEVVKNLIKIIIFVLVVGFTYDYVNKPQENNQDIEIEVEEVENISKINNMDELKIEILKEGTGEEAKNNDLVSVHYTGTLLDGTKFDSSLDRGSPFEFVLGAGSVIQGWEQGVLGMKVGEKRKLVIPPHLGYGASGSGIIPPNAYLVFEVELLEVK